MSQDFRPPVFFSWFEPIWASDKQAKVFLSSVLITPRYSNFLKSSAVGIPPRSQNRNLWESLVAFKGTIKRIPCRGKLFYHVRKELKKVLLNCLDLNFDSVVWCTLRSRIFRSLKQPHTVPKIWFSAQKSWACYGFSRYVQQYTVCWCLCQAYCTLVKNLNF